MNWVIATSGAPYSRKISAITTPTTPSDRMATSRELRHHGGHRRRQHDQGQRPGGIRGAPAPPRSDGATRASVNTIVPPTASVVKPIVNMM